MKDELKTKEQLVVEINDIRRLNDELREAEAALNSAIQSLQDSEERFRSVAQSAVDAIISIDSSDHVVFWNQGAENIFGYSEAEVLGKSVTIIIPDEYKTGHSQGVKNYLQTGMPALIGRTAELEGLKKNGERFPIELSLSTWKTKEGRFFSGIIRDISYRKDVERELEKRTAESDQRSEELRSLIQMVAHDLKSPIITIVGMVKILKQSIAKLPFEEKRDRVLEQIVTAAHNVEIFLGDLLSGLVVDCTQPETEPLSIEEIIKKTAAQHQQTMHERNIELVLDIEPELPVIYADKHRIAQVVDNLLSNAIKHMGDKPDCSIRIELRRRRDFVVTSVIDNGVGIPEEYHSKIFDRFFRIQRGEPGGTGLGLAISKTIVERHGGRIWVDSKEGEGSCFSFTLPVDKPSS
jgi:PAS domain S-box-containing protein